MIDQRDDDTSNSGPGAAPAQDPAAPPPLPRPMETRPQRLYFTGSGSEYFKIWIVNVLLTVVTLGIYSAWAKVRRSQYFYRHTRLAGAGFDYHAEPLAILKGRLIAAALFGGYYAAGLVGPIAGAVAFVVLILVLPFFVTRALRFRFQNSSYRGLRFRFAGTTGEAYRVFLGLGLASFATLFTLFPFWVHRQKRYVHANAMYGRTPFSFDAPVAAFYRIYLIAVGAGAALAVIVMTLLAVSVGTAVVMGANTPDSEPATAAVALGGLLFAVAYVFGVLGIWSFIGASVQNVVWNHTRIGPHAFKCEVRASSLFALTLTNVLGIAFTLGLYKPFAEVRLVKYIASAFTVVPAGSLDEFLAGAQPQAGAVGDEAVEMFDVDLAF